MKYFGTLLLMLLQFNSFATSISVTGNVSGVWTADTILVEGNISIAPGEELTISPGTRVLFQSYFKFDVNGSILAEGLQNDTIFFTIIDTSDFNNQLHGRGGWSGIRFRQLALTEDSSVFSYCKFQFSKATEDSVNCFGGAIMVNGFDKLRINNCVFFHNYSYYSGGAIYLNNSNAKVENCLFQKNISGNTGVIYGYGGGLCSINSSPIILKNEFYNNSSTGVGGAVSFDNSNPIFENNILQYNSSALGGALGVLRSSPNHSFTNNLITTNEAIFFGGGICCIRSFPVFSNLTISGNISSYGGGVYCNDSAAPSIYNSIIWGNTGLGLSVYIWDVYSAPNFYYCNIEGDTAGFEGSGGQMGYHGQYQNNINQDPQFLNSGMYPFQLAITSPCVDAGTPDAGFLNLPPIDLLGSPRIENSRIDMGVYERNNTTSTFSIEDESFSNILVYPNPFSQSVNIILPTKAQESIEISIYNSSGRIIKYFNTCNPDKNALWDGSDEQGLPVTKGFYLVLVKTAGGYYSAKAIKL